jgi:ATP-dependent DNA helicase RecG
LFVSARRLKGVGPNLFEGLARLVGLPVPSLPANGTEETSAEKAMATMAANAGPLVRDLIFHLPSGVVDRRASPPLPAAVDGSIATYTVKVLEHQPPPTAVRGSARGGGRKVPYKVICLHESGVLHLVYFSPRGDYLKQLLPVGQMRVVSGRIERFNHQVAMVHPDYVVAPEQKAEVQGVEPVYPLTYAMTNKQLTKIIHQAVAQIPTLPEWIETRLLQEKGWPHWREALTRAHHPQEAAELEPEFFLRQRLAYDELLANQLALLLIRARTRKQRGAVLSPTGRLRDAVLQALPYRLTEGQQQVLRDIEADITSGERMIRLLQGDVGSGKTIVALLAMLYAVENGRQAAMRNSFSLSLRRWG